MELKKYQKQVIKDLSEYLELIDQENDIVKAYRSFWAKKGARIGENGIKDYNMALGDTPHICFKVPTGGGKTFLACASIKPIFSYMPFTQTKIVTWLVPSTAILEQTIKNLKNVDHPYRQKLDCDFGGRVEIYTKEQLLNAQNFSPSSVREQLSICILSFDSLRSNKKDGRKMYQENSSLAPFTNYYQSPETLIDDVDNTALMQVLNQLSPIVIVDECHNAQSDLSVEMLKNLNPSFVLDLTATPKDNSNIISYVDAKELKKENMVKLPVIVYNRQNKQSVIADTIDLRNKLELQARINEDNGSKYIRPIVLFQAQPKTKEESDTFKKIKADLISFGIPENQIAIKTSEIDELKSQNLLSKKCEIRYIVTVNALKEGWDCPFAYILSTLANKTSSVDVEQILGRILRLPYANKNSDQFLNLSYVFTCSNVFRDTLEKIVSGLNKAGFSRNDCRVHEENEKVPIELIQHEHGEQINFNNVEASTDILEQPEETQELDFEQLKEHIINSNIQLNAGINSSEIDELLSIANQQNSEYEAEIEEVNETGSIPFELRDKMNIFYINEQFKEDIQSVKLPQFYIKAAENYFIEDEFVLLDKEHLCENFSLSNKDTEINFQVATDDVYSVDIDTGKSGTVPKYQKASGMQNKAFKKYFATLAPESKIKVCKNEIYKHIEKVNSIDDRELKDYVDRIVANMSTSQLEELELSPQKYGLAIKKKINELLDVHREKAFLKMLDEDIIVCRNNFCFPEYISPTSAISSIVNSLYEAEDTMNDFEHKVITSFAGLENILWWHRIIERNDKEFKLNGFINHYPDFILKTKKGNIVLIETKGDYLANEDSRQKLMLGRKWQEKSSGNFKYFMIFKDIDFKLDGAVKLDDFMDTIKKL